MHPELGSSHRTPATVTVPFDHRGARLSLSCLHRSGAGESLLYLHGLGSAKNDFRGAWALPEWSGYALTAFDAPGCGATRGYRSGVPLGVDDVVAAAEVLVARLELRNLTVIGHSMGGLAALLFTLRNPGVVRRLVSVEGNLGPEDCEIYSRRVFRRRFLGCERRFMEELEQELLRSERTGFPAAGRVLRANVEARAFFDYCRSIAEYSDDYPLLDAFLGLDLPRLYVHGAENGDLPHIRRLVREGSRVRAIPASDHFPASSNPGAYYLSLADFLRDSSR